jgi:hypothetical protein
VRCRGPSTGLRSIAKACSSSVLSPPIGPARDPVHPRRCSRSDLRWKPEQDRGAASQSRMRQNAAGMARWARTLGTTPHALLPPPPKIPIGAPLMSIRQATTFVQRIARERGHFGAARTLPRRRRTAVCGGVLPRSCRLPVHCFRHFTLLSSRTKGRSECRNGT